MGAAVLAPPASAGTTTAAPRSAVATAPPSDSDVPRAHLHHRPPPTCGDRVAYAGKQYCRASVEQVVATAYGSAVRVFLGQAIVLDVGADSVLVAQQRGPFCDEGPATSPSRPSR